MDASVHNIGRRAVLRAGAERVQTVRNSRKITTKHFQTVKKYLTLKSKSVADGLTSKLKYPLDTLTYFRCVCVCVDRHRSPV